MRSLRCQADDPKPRGANKWPKDPARNIARFKTGGHLNEFEFHKHREEIAEHLDQESTQLIPGTPPQEPARRVEEVMTNE